MTEIRLEILVQFLGGSPMLDYLPFQLDDFVIQAPHPSLLRLLIGGRTGGCVP